MELHNQPNQCVADITLTSLPMALSLSRHQLTFVIPLFLVTFCLSITFAFKPRCVSLFVMAKSRAVTKDMGSGNITSQTAPSKKIAKLVTASGFGAVPEV